MNFTTLEHIREVINDGAIYWTLKDRNNAAILAEQTTAISASDSYDKLTRNIKEMRGDFVKLSLSQRAPAEKGAGGNTKSFGPYNIEIQGNTNTPALISGPPVSYNGPSWIEHNNEVRTLDRKISELENRNRDLEREVREAKDSKIERILSRYEPVISGFVFGSPKAIQQAPQVNAPPLTFTVSDEQTYNNLLQVSQYPKFSETLEFLNNKGLQYWLGLIEQLENSQNANV